MAKPGAVSRVGRQGSAQTRRSLIDAAVTTLRVDGFVGASARAIAARAGCNQALVFYHFGSVAGLLLAALDAVSTDRLDCYRQAVESAATPVELVDVAAAIFEEDLDAGHVTVLVEMMAGAATDPDLSAAVAARIEPWTAFARQAIERISGGSALAAFFPAGDAAHAVVALYLGLELLGHLDSDRTPALALFAHARRLAPLLAALPAVSPGSGAAAGWSSPVGRDAGRSGPGSV